MEDTEARDARSLTEQERQKLCKMLFNALIDIRALCWEGKPIQAAEVAHAFHLLTSKDAPPIADRLGWRGI